MALYLLKEIDAWAVRSLRASGYDVTEIHRVYIPKHEADGSDAEVLYLDGRGNPRTAYMLPDGMVLASKPGF